LWPGYQLTYFSDPRSPIDGMNYNSSPIINCTDLNINLNQYPNIPLQDTVTSRGSSKLRISKLSVAKRLIHKILRCSRPRLHSIPMQCRTFSRRITIVRLGRWTLHAP
jgi:hypothetical protein